MPIGRTGPPIGRGFTRLRYLREKEGLSQLDLEIQSGINRTEISRIENGLKNIEFATIVKLAIALEVELHEFLK